MIYAILRILAPDTHPMPNVIQIHQEMKMIPVEDMPADAVSIGIGIHNVEEFVMGPAREVERYVHSIELLNKRDQHWAYEDGKKAIK